MLRLVAPCLLLAAAPLAIAQSTTSVDPSEVAKLRAAAEAKAQEIGKLTAGGNLTSSDEALKLLQQAVDELKLIREKLKALETRVDGQGKTLSSVSQVANKVVWGGYLQFQYQDTDRAGASTFDAFRWRRVRVGFNANVQPRVGARVSFDLAAGNNQNQTQMRDSWIWYDFSGGSKLGRDRAFAGQLQIWMGYELERSSADRELPERSQYNQTLFNTERSRGVKIRREGRDGTLTLGTINSLAINDPEQANLSSGPGNKLAALGQARLIKGNTSVGLSAFAGDRPAYTANNITSPEVPRRFVYLDFEQRDLLWKGFTVRGEVMRGNDRLPNATANAANVDHPMSGFHVMGNYRLSSFDQLALRWEHFDPNLDDRGTALHGLGLAYIRHLTPELKFTLAHEAFTGQTPYRLTTFRVQVRF